MTVVNRCMSDSICAFIGPGVPAPGLKPIALKARTEASDASAVLSAPLSLATIAGGVPFGAIMPFQPGIQEILDSFEHVFVVEMNDQDQQGRGQLGARLRSAFSHPDIRGITKTDGLSFKVREISQQMEAKLAQNAKEQP